MGIGALKVNSKEPKRQHSEHSASQKPIVRLRAWISMVLSISWKMLKILTH